MIFVFIVSLDPLKCSNQSRAAKTLTPKVTNARNLINISLINRTELHFLKVKMSSPSKQRRWGGRRRFKGESQDDSNTSSSSAIKIGTSVDLLTLILARVPLKSLLLFKSVSKFWLSTINDPHFAHQHFMRNPSLSIPGLFWGSELASDTKNKYVYIPLDGNIDGYVPFETLAFKVRRLAKVGIKILQSCNGSLLCGNVVSRNSDRTYYIYNPFTKQYKIIPPSQIRSLCFPYLMNVV